MSGVGFRCEYERDAYVVAEGMSCWLTGIFQEIMEEVFPLFSNGRTWEVQRLLSFSVKEILPVDMRGCFANAKTSLFLKSLSFKWHPKWQNLKLGRPSTHMFVVAQHPLTPLYTVWNQISAKVINLDLYTIFTNLTCYLLWDYQWQTNAWTYRRSFLPWCSSSV